MQMGVSRLPISTWKLASRFVPRNKHGLFVFSIYASHGMPQNAIFGHKTIPSVRYYIIPDDIIPNKIKHKTGMIFRRPALLNFTGLEGLYNTAAAMAFRLHEGTSGNGSCWDGAGPLSRQGLAWCSPFIPRSRSRTRCWWGQTLPDGSVQRQTQLLVPLVCVMIGAQLLRSMRTLRHDGVSGILSQNVQQDIPPPFCTTTCAQDAGFYTRYRTGDLMTRLTGDLDMVRHTVCWISYNAVRHLPVSIFHDISVQCERR